MDADVPEIGSEHKKRRAVAEDGPPASAKRMRTAEKQVEVHVSLFFSNSRHEPMSMRRQRSKVLMRGNLRSSKRKKRKSRRNAPEQHVCCCEKANLCAKNPELLDHVSFPLMELKSTNPTSNQLMDRRVLPQGKSHQHLSRLCS